MNVYNHNNKDNNNKNNYYYYVKMLLFHNNDDVAHSNTVACAIEHLLTDCVHNTHF